MKHAKHLSTGDARLGFAGDILTTDGVGSCVVVCLWDPIRTVGGMAHMFQPSADMIDPSRPRSAGASPDAAVPYLLGQMLGLGAKAEDIRARLVGGGNMFEGVEDGSLVDVGRSILSSTLTSLRGAGLTPHSQAVGGKLGRSVKFYVSSGVIQVGLTNGQEVLL